MFVLRMGEPIKILDLARSYIKLAGLEVGRDASIIITGNRGNEKMTEELWSSAEHVVPTSFESIMRVKYPACADLAVLRPAVDTLLDAARSHRIWGQLVIAPGWYIDEMKDWIPAFAESTPQKHPSPYTERLGGIEKKCSGGNDGPKARAVTNWYAACSGETHQRWIDEGGHSFQA